MLIIFDIDGTLTETTGDWPHYKRVFSAQFDVEEAAISDNFDHYPHITDSAVFYTLCERHAVTPTQLCYLEFAARYVEIMQSVRAEPIPGAAGLLADIMKGSKPIAVATGAFVQKALARLQVVGISNIVPMATANDHRERAEIMRISRVRAERHCNAEFSDIVYVGDGLWDARACADLGWRFVARTTKPEIFQPFGVPAQCIVPDYSNIAKFHRALRHARVPQRS